MKYIDQHWTLFAAFLTGVISHGLFFLSGWYFTGFAAAAWRVFNG